MKDIDEELSDRIDDYLLDRLPEAERDAFEAEMLVSPAIQQEVLFRSSVSNALWLNGQTPGNQSEPELEAVVDSGWWGASKKAWKELPWPAKALAIVAAVAAVGMLAYLWGRQPERAKPEAKTIATSDTTFTADIPNRDKSLVFPDTPKTPAIQPKPAKKTLPESSAGVSAPPTDTMEKEAWSAAVQSGTCEAYRAFVQKYPKSTYLPQAEQAIREQCLPTPEHLLPVPIQKLRADMVRVEGGSFLMGCRNEETPDTCAASEKPEHLVRVPAFSIGRYEVTQAQWRAVIGTDPPRLTNKGCDDCPVEYVSWLNAQEFIGKLNAMTKRNYRLPSEAEWEFAARGGAVSKGYRFSGSNDLGLVAWSGKYTKKATQPVGTKAPNELGLYDMSGNVHEWTMDCYNANYDGAPTDGTAWLTKGNCELRVARGGSWNPADPGGYCRPAFRLYFPATTAIPVVGFRLVSE